MSVPPQLKKLTYGYKTGINVWWEGEYDSTIESSLEAAVPPSSMVELAG